MTVNDNTSQKEIGEHLVKQEAYIEEQFYFYKSKKESLLKKKELINSIIEKGKGE